MVQSVFCWSSLQSRGKVYQRRIEDVQELNAWKQRGKNWTSKLSTLQSGSGPLAFMHMSDVTVKSDHLEHKLPWLNDEMPDKLFNHSILTVGF